MCQAHILTYASVPDIYRYEMLFVDMMRNYLFALLFELLAMGLNWVDDVCILEVG